MKTCRRCDQNKPLDDFRADSRYKDGHGSWCKQCHRERNSSWAKESRARLTTKATAWRAQNADVVRISNLKHKRANKERLAQSYASWSRGNRDKRRAIDAKRRAAKRQATPAWADRKKISAIYKRAVELERESGQRMHVDHIIPLDHPLVCGLHCEANLQILPGHLNEAKRNRFSPFSEALTQPDMFVERPAPPKQEVFGL